MRHNKLTCTNHHSQLITTRNSHLCAVLMIKHLQLRSSFNQWKIVLNHLISNGSSGSYTSFEFLQVDSDLASLIGTLILVSILILVAKYSTGDIATSDCCLCQTNYCVLLLRWPITQYRHKFFISLMHDRGFGLIGPRQVHAVYTMHTCRTIYSGTTWRVTSSVPTLYRRYMYAMHVRWQGWWWWVLTALSSQPSSI